MILIPLRTDTPVRCRPTANYVLIAANVLIFLLTYDFNPPRPSPLSGVMPVARGPLRSFLAPYRLMLDGADPEVYQLFTYQFLHDGWQHLLGNLLFLWVFGNSINGKMGQALYVLFYLSCGVFAGTAYMAVNDASMLGASGAIAGVTTAFLVLFPRSRTSFFYWFFVIGYFELPSMLLIVAKVIVYDNLIAPMFSGAEGVAYSAHIAGYTAGAVITMILLLFRVIPRDQFDLIALWKRAYQRRAFARAVADDPMADVRAQYGQMSREDLESDLETAPESPPTDARLDAQTEIRGQISDAYGAGDLSTTAQGYLRLLSVDSALVLPRQQQLDVANYFVGEKQYAQAAEAYEKYLARYPGGEQQQRVRLMLGVIYAKHLSNYERAEEHLLDCRDRLSESQLIEQCNEWLAVAARALGRPTAESQ